MPPEHGVVSSNLTGRAITHDKQINLAGSYCVGYGFDLVLLPIHGVLAPHDSGNGRIMSLGSGYVFIWNPNRMG